MAIDINSYGKIYVTGSGGTPPLSVSLDAPPTSLPGPGTDNSPFSGWHAPPYTFTGLNTGSYRVFLQDAVQCIQSYVVNLEESQYPTFSFHATDVSCWNEQNGSLTGSVEGGVPPFTYSVTDPNGDTTTGIQAPNLYLLNTGSYLIKIEDAIGCAIQQNFVISGPSSMSFSASADYTNLDSSSITFHNVLGNNDATTYYVAEFDRKYLPSNFGTQIALYSSSLPSVPIPGAPNQNARGNPLRGGHFGAYMETTSSIANVTCSTDMTPIEVFERKWEYRQSFCESANAISNPYRILNFYRVKSLLPDGSARVADEITPGSFLDGMPLDGVNIRIYTGSASEVNYDPNSPTRDKLVAEFNTSGSLDYTGSFSYITSEDLVVVVNNAETNTRYTQRVLRTLPFYRKDYNDITASLLVTGALMSGSDLNYVKSDYFGNIGNAANTSSLILTMSKINDEVESTTINFWIQSLYGNLNPNS